MTQAEAATDASQASGSRAAARPSKASPPAACWCGTAAGIASGLGSRVEERGAAAASTSPATTSPAAGVGTPAAPQSLEWDAIYNAINHGADEPEKHVQQFV